jgi:hypothetical protein
VHRAGTSVEMPVATPLHGERLMTAPADTAPSTDGLGNGSATLSSLSSPPPWQVALEKGNNLMPEVTNNLCIYVQ